MVQLRPAGISPKANFLGNWGQRPNNGKNRGLLGGLGWAARPGMSLAPDARSQPPRCQGLPAPGWGDERDCGGRAEGSLSLSGCRPGSDPLGTCTRVGAGPLRRPQGSPGEGAVRVTPTPDPHSFHFLAVPDSITGPAGSAQRRGHPGQPRVGCAGQRHKQETSVQAHTALEPACQHLYPQPSRPAQGQPLA